MARSMLMSGTIWFETQVRDTVKAYFRLLKADVVGKSQNKAAVY
jgi:hypothetical protein